MKNYYHPAVLIHRHATRYGKKTALKHFDKKEKKWKSISWRKFSRKSMLVAWSLAELGINEHDNIGIFAQNMPEYFYVEFGAFANRVATVPIYATSSSAQLRYIVEDANIEYLFVGEQVQYNNAIKIQNESKVIKKIIAFDNKIKFNAEDTTSVYFDYFISTGENSTTEVMVKVRMKSRRESDTACIIYTSGTTGEPKGVVLPHSCFIQVFKSHDILLDPVLGNNESSVCFLPLAHVFEKAWSYFCMHRTIPIIINQDAREIQKTVKQMKPTLLCSVPRFWEKVYDGIIDKVASSKGIVKWLFEDAIRTGKKHNLDYLNNGIPAPIGNRIKFFLYNNTVYRLIKSVIGIQHGTLFPTAGAPLSDSITEFLLSLDIPIFVGYGLTETTATVSCYPYKKIRIGSVGVILNGVNVKISDDGEILVKGDAVMKEYYKKTEATAEAFTSDGYFRTGDAGFMDGETLFLTERIKDLYKTSNGKYIAPQSIETKIGEDKYIDMIATIANNRKFVSALIVPNYQELEKYAIENNISYHSIDDLITNVDILRMMDGRIEMKQVNFASYEKIKKYILLPEPFTMETGELTNTLKIRRKIVEEKFANQINKLYEES